MADTRKRQLQSQKDRRAAAAAARRRASRKRFGFILGSLVLVGALVALLVWIATPSKSKSTTSAAATGAKPCVKETGTPPPGAPAVPVRTGAAPKQLVTKDLKAGTGAVVPDGATVTVNYIGVACSTGKIFDSSYSRNQPATFPLSGVIQGWQKGIPGMKVGGQRLLGIPPDQAYGPRGSPPAIGPNEALWFVVEVLDVKTS